MAAKRLRFDHCSDLVAVDVDVAGAGALVDVIDGGVNTGMQS